jgi:hypothetical protein
MSSAIEFIVTFKDIEVVVFAFDREDAQEAAIEESERVQGYSTEIVRIRRA